MKFIFCTVLAVQTSFAASKWMKVRSGDRKCTFVCSRSSMDTAIDPTNGKSICAGVDKDGQTISTQSEASSSFACQLKSSSLERQEFCLCTDDGAIQSTELTWIPSTEEGRCDRSCSKNSESTKIAVYGYRVNGSWQHVCRPHDASGGVGYVGGGQLKCQTTNGAHAKFDCLCSSSYAGDLEPFIDP